MATSTTGGTPHAGRRDESNTGGREPAGPTPEVGPGDQAGSAAGDRTGAALHLEPGAAPPPPALPWLAWEPGTRVVVRYRLADGLHDALGDLLEVAADQVTVRTRRGDIRVEASTMVTGKKVPPPAW